MRYIEAFCEPDGTMCIVLRADHAPVELLDADVEGLIEDLEATLSLSRSMRTPAQPTRRNRDWWFSGLSRWIGREHRA